jgi:DNA polymerase-3 subunit beta
VNETGIAEDMKLQVIVPRKALLELRKALTQDDEVVTVGFGKGAVSFDMGSSVLTSRTIDGKYPDWQRVIPQENKHACAINAETLKQAAARVGIVSSEKYKAVRMIVAPGVLRLYTTNQEAEEAIDEIDTEYDGPEIELAFTLQYLLDALSSIETDDVCLRMRNGETALLLTNEPVDTALYLVMPQRV